jgi:hypothetical protein
MVATWISLHSTADLEMFLDSVGALHDGCLKELYLWTGHYVAHDLSMDAPSCLDTNVRALFQRQFRGPSAIELLFQEVVRVEVDPTPDDFDSIIDSAGFHLAEGVFTFETDTITIQAKKVSWRDVSQWMGAHARYGPEDSVMPQPGAES